MSSSGVRASSQTDIPCRSRSPSFEVVLLGRRGHTQKIATCFGIFGVGRVLLTSTSSMGPHPFVEGELSQLLNKHQQLVIDLRRLPRFFLQVILVASIDKDAANASLVDSPRRRLTGVGCWRTVRTTRALMMWNFLGRGAGPSSTPAVAMSLLPKCASPLRLGGLGLCNRAVIQPAPVVVGS